MRKKSHTQYAAILLAIVSFIANVTAITGLIMNNASAIVITAALLATLYGLYLFLRRWGKPIDGLALLAVLVIVAGSVMLTLSVKAYRDSPDVAGGSETTTTTDKPQSVGRGGEPVKPNSKHDVVFEKEFIMKPEDGLELDDEKGTLYAQQSDAKSPLDFYLSRSASLLYVTIQNFYTYQPLAKPTGDTNKDQYNACVSLLQDSQTGDKYLYAATVTPGQQYCAKTTRGRIALITMQEMISLGEGSSKNSADLTVKLWN